MTNEPRLLTLSMNAWVRVRLSQSGMHYYRVKAMRINQMRETPIPLEPDLTDGRWRLPFGQLITFLGQAERLGYDYPIIPDDVIYEEPT